MRFPLNKALKTFTVCAVLAGPARAAVIQPGMILNILVKGDEMLTQQVKVLENGAIDYPLYQDSPVVGMTTSELQNVLTLKLANYTDAPFVLVTILSELPIQVQVLGQIKKPGPTKISPNASLQEVLAASGGPTDYANLERIKVIHKGQPEEEASLYNLQEFMTTGKVSLLPKLLDGDRIIVLAASKQMKIKVLGAVNQPGYFDHRDSTSLFDALYLAGGPASEANLSKIRILGYQDKRETDAIVNLQKYIDGGKLSEVPLVEAGDVIIVYRKSFTWSKSLSAVRDIVTLVTAWFVISQLFR